MELLIPGLLLVGFMVWASTKIKKRAAEAFEKEMIENDRFSIEKPDGFLAPVDPENGLLFSAYSKEFGHDEASRIRQASAEIREFKHSNIEDIAEKIEASSLRTISKNSGVMNERKYYIMHVERLEEDVMLESFYKVLSVPDTVYELSVSVIPEKKEEFMERIDTFLNTFTAN